MVVSVMDKPVRFTVVMDLLMRLQHDGRLSSYSTTYVHSKPQFEIVTNEGTTLYKMTSAEAYAFALGARSQ